ncbi:MAG: hypothetical protein M1305_03370 [Candidatus Marsarchaeota archaeon]|nr:hypothetical protein [Candidatus Marsarchaeota archaeon]
MVIDGTWDVLIKTAVMPLDATLVFTTEGDVLSGTSSTSFGSASFTGGKVNGNKIEFMVDSPTPFGPATLEVKATIEGDELTGVAVMMPAGMKATLTGMRAA